MVRVYLSLGSNIEPARYIPESLALLADAFGELMLSPIYENEAVGFAGDNFFNLAVGLETDLPVGKLNTVLRAIEAACGRQRGEEKFSSRTLDIDILTYGDVTGTVDGIELPRDEIEKYAFVIKPLADIAPDDCHPVSGKSYASLCAEIVTADAPLWRVELKPSY